MFSSKKRTNLPPRPKPPTKDQIEEDLTNAPKRDVIFTLTASETTGIPVDQGNGHKPSTNRSERKRDSESPQEETDLKDITHTFQEAATFVEKNDEIEELMVELDERCEKLKEVGSKLQDAVDNVKKQALVALHGY
ncbi:UPF0449 protein C19orf25-like [Oratosquilla oratoria]|uniref:UPF0449 protein C19orf25-like n=1 Tax=Oratosquilla oratoria TaxID=337810 RepID=UPI003F76DD16